MSDAAVAASGSYETAAAAVPRSNYFVTPWRHELANLRDQMVRMIQENDDPEMQFRTASDMAGDITHAIKMSLRKQHGRVFNSLIDGPEPAQGSAA